MFRGKISLSFYLKDFALQWFRIWFLFVFPKSIVYPIAHLLVFEEVIGSNLFWNHVLTKDAMLYVFDSKTGGNTFA